MTTEAMYALVSRERASGNFSPGPDGEGSTRVASWTRPRRALPVAVGVSMFVGALLIAGKAQTHFKGHVLDQVGNVEKLFSADPGQCPNFEYVFLEKLIRSNLGGKGPDFGAEGMVFEATHVIPGADGFSWNPILMVINATSALKTFPASNTLNGHYAVIGCEGNTNVKLTFRFLDAVTQSLVTIPMMRFTFVDMDTHQTGNEVEYVRAWNFANYIVTQNTLVKASEEGDGSVTFTATIPGGAIDNPKDAFLLTSEQKNKAVTLEFRDASEFQIELGSKDIVDFHQRTHRAFRFVPQPTLLCAKTQGDDTTGGIKVDSEPTDTTTTAMTFKTSTVGPMTSTVGPQSGSTVTSTMVSGTVTQAEKTRYCVIEIAMFNIHWICFDEKQWWMFWK